MNIKFIPPNFLPFSPFWLSITLNLLLYPFIKEDEEPPAIYLNPTVEDIREAIISLPLTEEEKNTLLGFITADETTIKKQTATRIIMQALVFVRKSKVKTNSLVFFETREERIERRNRQIEALEKHLDKSIAVRHFCGIFFKNLKT